MISELVGFTTSGKEIRFYLDLQDNELYIGWVRMIVAFTEVELMESYCVYEYLGHREAGKKCAEQQRINTFIDSMNEIKRKYLGKRFGELCKILQLEHFHDRLRKGRQLVKVEFRD